MHYRITLARIIRITLFISIGVLIGGCATPGKQLEAQTNAYKQLPSPKAFSVAYFPNGVWVAGWSYNQPSLERAIEVALLQCQEQAAKRALQASCRLLYENDFFVSNDSGNSVPAATNQQVTLVPSKSGNDPAPCVTSYCGPVHVNGYYRKDGTYVRPYTRSK